MIVVLVIWLLVRQIKNRLLHYLTNYILLVLVSGAIGYLTVSTASLGLVTMALLALIAVISFVVIIVRSVELGLQDLTLLRALGAKPLTILLSSLLTVATLVTGSILTGMGGTVLLLKYIPPAEASSSLAPLLNMGVTVGLATTLLTAILLARGLWQVAKEEVLEHA